MLLCQLILLFENYSFLTRRSFSVVGFRLSLSGLELDEK